MDLNSKKWNEIIKDKDHPPIFALCYAPWCIHCKNVLPQWNQFTESMKDEARIIAADINCSDDQQFCMDLQIRGYPSFIVRYKESTRFIQISRSLKSFMDYAAELMKSYSVELGIIQKLKPKKFPYFIFSYQKTDTEIDNIVQKAINNPHLKNGENFNLNNNNYNGNNALTVFYNLNAYLTMTEQFTQENIEEFINEHQLPFLGSWSYNALKPLKRKFAVYITNDYTVPKYVRIAAQESLKTLGWGSTRNIGVAQAKKTFRLSNEDLPAIVVIDPKPHTFMKITNIETKDQIKELVEMVQNDKASYSLFDPEVLNFESTDNDDKVLNLKKTNFFPYVLIMGIVIALGAGIYIFITYNGAKQD